MKTKTYYLCDSCGAEIRFDMDGFILQGTIHSVNGTTKLYGADDNKCLHFQEIEPQAICRKCFKKSAFGEDVLYLSGSLGGPG
jgi:hypothetical protein